MTTDRRLLGAALGLALIVAACGGSSASPAASSGAAASQAAGSSAPTDAAASADTSTQSQDANAPGISLAPGNASGLEAMIPDKVGNVTFTKTSFDYSSIPWASLGGALGSDNVDKVLKDNGKSLADVKFAMAVSSAGTATMPTMVYALQVSGLDASTFVSELDSSYADATAMTVGGKSVKGSLTSGYGTVTYLHNDVAFIAIGSEADLNTLVAALP